MTKYSSTETSNSNIYSSVMFLKKCNPNFEAIEIKSLQNQNSSESTLLRVRSGGAGFGCCTGCLVCVIMSDSPNLLGPIESLLMVLLDQNLYIFDQRLSTLLNISWWQSLRWLYSMKPWFSLVLTLRRLKMSRSYYWELMKCYCLRTERRRLLPVFRSTTVRFSGLRSGWAGGDSKDFLLVVSFLGCFFSVGYYYGYCFFRPPLRSFFFFYSTAAFTFFLFLTSLGYSSTSSTSCLSSSSSSASSLTPTLQGLARSSILSTMVLQLTSICQSVDTLEFPLKISLTVAKDSDLSDWCFCHLSHPTLNPGHIPSSLCSTALTTSPPFTNIFTQYPFTSTQANSTAYSRHSNVNSSNFISSVMIFDSDFSSFHCEDFSIQCSSEAQNRFSSRSLEVQRSSFCMGNRVHSQTGRLDWRNRSIQRVQLQCGLERGGEAAEGQFIRVQLQHRFIINYYMNWAISLGLY